MTEQELREQIERYSRLFNVTQDELVRDVLISKSIGCGGQGRL